MCPSSAQFLFSAFFVILVSPHLRSYQLATGQPINNNNDNHKTATIMTTNDENKSISFWCSSAVMPHHIYMDPIQTVIVVAVPRCA